MRVLLFVLFALLPAAAEAGLRATYGVAGSRPLTIEVADNGDVAAELSPYRRLLVRGGLAVIVQESLTGPVVMRLSDLQAVVEERRRADSRRPPTSPAIELIPRGPMEVNGRTGTAYWRATPYGPAPEQLVAVISVDPALAPLGRAMRHVREAQRVFEALQTGLPAEMLDWTRPIDALLAEGTPLRHWGWTLRTVESAAIDPSSFVPPTEPQSAAAVAARYDPERARAEEEQAMVSQMIVRAVSAGGRLWLLTDRNALSSLAEGETRRTAHETGGPVLDICAANGSLLALTGRPSRGASWAIRRFDEGRWQTLRTVPRRGDSPVSLACGAGAAMLVTSDRLIDLAIGAAVALSPAPELSVLRTVTHVTENSVFLGFNKGEWGGGAQRIDRRTGRVETLENEGSGSNCEGPLNTGCDPVNGLATIPWRRDCVAAAIGLVHFMPSGRITEICPGRITQLAAARGDVDPDDAEKLEAADAGGYGSIAFFGLTAAGDRLLAAGHDGLYTIGPDGVSERQRWPRFVSVDGLLVSFAHPEVILVVSRLNQRASVSGGAPLLVPR